MQQPMTAASEAVAAHGALLERLLAEPAPFLALLHAVQREHGHLAEEPLRRVAAGLGRPIADVFGAASFYHYFRLEPPEVPPPLEICRGPACARHGAERIAAEQVRDVRFVSCPGRCDRPVPVFDGAEVYAGVRAGLGEWEPAADRLPIAIDSPEVLFRCARAGIPWAERGAFPALFRSAREPEAALAELRASGLSGRGGAGFPAADKWQAVRAAEGAEKYVVCNADEGEPGCFKDRALLAYDPHAVLEGMLHAALVTGARTGIVYLRYEYRDLVSGLERAIGELAAHGFLGEAFRIVVRLGAGAYVCGEETALLESLEGKRPWPRERPPYPTERGLFGMPTLVGNVETFAAATAILHGGAAAWRALGRDGEPGTRLFSVSGDVARPGVYELAAGTPLAELLRHAGGPARDHAIAAVALGGISGGFLPARDFDVALAPAAVRARGAELGACGVIAYDAGRCMVRAAAECLRFYADESCGKCFPCRIGCERSRTILDEWTARAPREGAAEELRDLGAAMEDASACGLGRAAPLVVRTLFRAFPDQFEAHRAGRCPAGECAT